jgi:hypothetical protein
MHAPQQPVDAPRADQADTAMNPSSRPACCGKSVVAIAVIAALAIGFTIWWFAGLRNRFEPVNFGIVEPGRLYRSGQITAPVIRKTLRNNHIALIVNLSLDDTPDERAEAAAAHDLGVERVNLGLSGDGLGHPSVYPTALADIVKANREGKAVLVHCQSGAQRTGGIIAAYRILVEGKSPDDAFAEMREYGHNPKHNPNLIPWIRQHLPEWKAQLASYEASAPPRPADSPQ